MKHTVMFRLKGTDAERKELAAKFAEALMKLPEIIPELKSMKTGLSKSPSNCNFFIAINSYSGA